MTYAKHCCNTCASSGMGDLAGIASSFAAFSPAEKAVALAAGLGALAAALVYLGKPSRKRPRHHYYDPELSRTQRIPRESMSDVVWERRR